MEHSILATQIARQDLTVQRLLEELEPTDLSADFGRVSLHQPAALERGDLLNERGRCSLQIPHQGKIELQLELLTEVKIHQETSLFPSIRVQRTDSRFRWKGVIVEVKEERELALVNWDGSQRWHAFSELCPLDELGNPLPDRATNIFQAALRGRGSLGAIRQTEQIALVKTPLTHMSQSSAPEQIQMNLFEKSDFEAWPSKSLIVPDPQPTSKYS